MGLFCLLGLPGEVTRDGESRVQEKTGPVEQGGLTAFPHFLYCVIWKEVTLHTITLIPTLNEWRVMLPFLEAAVSTSII